MRVSAKFWISRRYLEVNTKSLAINGNTDLQFLGVSNANVAFGSGSNDTLTLCDSEAFTGTGVGLAPGNHLDLMDISFGAGSTLGCTQNTSNTGAVLSVSDNPHAARIALLGQYILFPLVMGTVEP